MSKKTNAESGVTIVEVSESVPSNESSDEIVSVSEVTPDTGETTPDTGETTPDTGKPEDATLPGGNPDSSSKRPDKCSQCLRPAVENCKITESGLCESCAR